MLRLRGWEGIRESATQRVPASTPFGADWNWQYGLAQWRVHWNLLQGKFSKSGNVEVEDIDVGEEVDDLENIVSESNAPHKNPQHSRGWGPRNSSARNIQVDACDKACIDGWCNVRCNIRWHKTWRQCCDNHTD